MTLKVAVLIPAAGSGTRYQGTKRKQFDDLNGRAVFVRTIECFADRADVVRTIVAIPKEEEELFDIRWGAKLSFYGVKAIVGGAERYETIRKLLDEVQDDTLDLVALHDAVRPCVTQGQIDAVFQAAFEHGAAILANPVAPTLKKASNDGCIEGTVDRAGLYEAQTPQVFRPDIIRKAYENIVKVQGSVTDDAQLVEAMGLPVKLVESDAGNIKITTAIDMAIASAVLKEREKEKKPNKPIHPFAEDGGW